MRVARGKVVDGKVVIDGTPLADGTIVTLLVREADETFEVTAEQEAQLLESIAQAEAGQTLGAHEHLEALRRR